MLSRLDISNLAVIDSQSLPLKGGFTVLTGETGAGKSVLIDSINMILGHRTDRSLVRHGKKAAVAEAVFSGLTEEIKKLLEDEGIFDAEEEISVSRSLSAEGRSVCKINGVAVSAAFLKQLGAELVNIHGQQDNQKLLSKKYHTDILDSFIKVNGGADIILGYNAAYEVYEQAKKKYDKASADREKTEKEINYLKFVSEELGEADIAKGEEAELSERQEILANAVDIYMALSAVYDVLYDGEVNAYGILSSAASHTNKVASYSERIREFSESLSDIMYQIKDIASDIRDFRDENEPDEGALSEVEERLGLIFDLKRKYKKSADELSDYAKEVEEELLSLEAEDIAELEAKYIQAKENALEWGKKLSGERERCKKILEKQICRALADLNMAHARFEILLEQRPLSASGLEAAEFMMCTAGQGELRPMEKIASGGELSRIMLAIKYVLSEVDDCDTLIFDEIDTGVSGISAQAVADKLYALSKNKQVICITHLAQIASMADTHVLISKSLGEDGAFYTNVSALDEEGRIEELSRIMAGEAKGDKTSLAARDLLEKSKSKKADL